MSNLAHILPFFVVSNIQNSASFYVDKLGFQVHHIGPEGDPYWAIVGRDDISIMLKAIAPDIKPVPNYTRHEWAPWDAYIATADPDALFEEYTAGDVTFHQTIQNNSDNIRGFAVADADGYILFFGRPNT